MTGISSDEIKKFIDNSTGDKQTNRENSSQAPVLIVDDDDRNLFTLQEALKPLGEDISTANSGKEALKKILGSDFAVILLDVKMPEMSGFEVASLIRENKQKAHIPIIFVTGHDKGEVQMFQGYDLGAVDYLIKPINPTVLLSKVKVFVDLWRKSAELLRQKDMEKKKIDLEKANQYKSEFLSNISHEIRSPLNSILLAAGFLLKNGEDNLTERQMENLHIINNSANDIHFLVDDLLDHKKIERGIISIHQERFALSRICDHIKSTYNTQYSAKNVAFSLDWSNIADNTFCCDPRRLEQILRNLVSNALKFTPPGGLVEVTAQLMSDEKNVLEIIVADTGIGVLKEDRTLIFERFGQLEEGAKYKHQGTGLGLAISKHLAELMKGSLEVKENDGQGTIFILRIPESHKDTVRAPYSSLPSKTIAETKVEGSEYLKGISTLIVDDEVRNIFALRQILLKYELTVSSSLSGAEAIKLCKDGGPFDLVIMDLMMPDMNGFETVQELRKINGYNKIPILAVSGHTSAQNEDVVQAEFDDFIRKPIDETNLISRIVSFITSKNGITHEDA